MLRRRLMKSGVPEGTADLGLPSGTLWATGNITKDTNGNYSIASPTDYGAYFSWGDIEGHNVAYKITGQEENYKFSYSNYNDGISGQGHNLTADFTSGDATYDAARAKLGSPWRIPTYDEFNELLNSCTWNWKARDNTDYNNVPGYEVVGPNGGKIFLPAADCFVEDTLKQTGGTGRYWSSRYSSKYYAYELDFDRDNYYSMNDLTRNYGSSIRAVQ